MPLFLCRWSNGDCSVVWARNTEEAIVELDQVANAESCPITEVQTFQVAPGPRGKAHEAGGVTVHACSFSG